MQSSTILLFLLSILFAFPGTSDADQTSHQAFIYATITFEHGTTHTGYLRWESEEATWDDLFHSGYRENPWLEFIDTKALKKEKRDRFYETHGLIKRLAYALNEDEESGPGWRMFLIRFGDIRSFEIHDGQDDYVITADGSRHRIGGYANDNGSDLWLYEKDQDPLEIEWNDLISIEFSSAPKDHAPFARRLYGTVETAKGSFTGPIMWDKSECLDIDNLDGENSSGDLSIQMGDVRSIEKVDNRSVLIEKKDGTSFSMGGSNDVNDDNRGIWILTQDQGWVDIPWKRFIKATFSEEIEGGNPRSAFDNSQPLRGTVLLTDGTSLSGRLVYDLDEGFAWDVFNGSLGAIDYDIPFTLISSIERLPQATCRLSLISGKTLELSGNQDTGDDHGGMLVLNEEETSAQYVPWRLVQTVGFTKNP